MYRDKPCKIEKRLLSSTPSTMGSGVSSESLPEKLDENACRDIAGDLWDEGTFSLEKDEDGFISKSQFIDFVNKATSKTIENNEEQTVTTMKTKEEESDDEFEAELVSLDRKTYKVKKKTNYNSTFNFICVFFCSKCDALSILLFLFSFLCTSIYFYWI